LSGRPHARGSEGGSRLDDRDIRGWRIEDAIAKAKAAAGEKHVGLLGASIAHQCLDAGLLDEIVVQVAPVMLGDGVPLYRVGGGKHVKLEKTAVSESGPLTDLRFRVRS
jgi:dihydrofolate reductase